MTVTEERSKLEAPVEHKHGVRGWVVAVIGVLALASGVLIGTVIDSGDEGSSEVASSVVIGEPGDDAVDFAQRWGEALESGDSDALRALYGSQDDGGATIIDRMYRAVWADVDSAVDRIINNPLEFESVDLVRVEEFGQVFVAEYEIEGILPEEGPPDSVTVVVVFYDLAEEQVGQSDIYLPMWSSFVTGEIGGYPQRTAENETDWIIID